MGSGSGAWEAQGHGPGIFTTSDGSLDVSHERRTHQYPMLLWELSQSQKKAGKVLTPLILNSVRKGPTPIKFHHETNQI